MFDLGSMGTIETGDGDGEDESGRGAGRGYVGDVVKLGEGGSELLLPCV